MKDKEKKMTDEEWLSQITKERIKMIEILDVATEEQLKKCEKKFPEIVDKIRESMRCEKPSERLKISMKALKMSYQIGRRNR